MAITSYKQLATNLQGQISAELCDKIAAADDLLTALEDMLSCAKSANWHPDNSVMRNARTAIDMARGES